MSVAAGLAFLVGGATGAPTRYLLDGFVQRRTKSPYPWGTFVINASGSLFLGILTGLAMHGDVSASAKTVAGTGFCGAFTTFSTFTYETIRLAEQGATRAAFGNVAANVIVGTLVAGLGLALALH